MTGVTSLLDTPPEEGFDRITRLVTTLLDAPVSLVSLVDERRQFFKSVTGLTGWAAEARGTPLSHSFCRLVVERDETLAVEDARRHPLLRDNPAIPELGVVAYLGEPIRSCSGRPVGALCAISNAPRLWSERDRETLRGLAGAVDAELGFRESLAERDRALEALEATNARLSEARRAAEEALAERTRFFIGLGHELRTPLNGVLGGLSLLEASPGEAQAATYRKMVRSSAEALMTFVDDVVDYARHQAEAGPAAEAAAFDPRAPLAAAAETVAAAAAAKGLALRTETAETAPGAWVSDPDRITRLLINLAGNAIKYTDRGEVALGVAAEDGRLVYRVRDTGVGVPESMSEVIFRPFERGDPELARRTRGTGLGLAIARRNAESFGARLTLERSAPGCGSIFRLEVPRHAPAPSAAPAAAVAA